MSTDLIERDDTPPGGDVIEIATSRQAQEVQAMIILAKKFPRDIRASTNRIMAACDRKGLAEVATYKYPKGGTNVEGPSIRLAECMAQCWGNIDSGLIELTQTTTESHVMAYAWDTETNVRSSKVFTVKHIRHRKDGASYVLTDPREIYENVANAGARRVRSAILAVIPKDIQDTAVERCKATMHPGEKELPEQIKKMVERFAEMAVTVPMLEKRLGRNIGSFDGKDIVSLRGVYTSLKDGMSTVEDWFESDAPKPIAASEGESKTEQTAKELKQKKAKKAKPAETDVPTAAGPVAPTAAEAETTPAPPVAAAAPAMSAVQVEIACIMLQAYIERLGACKTEGDVRQTWSEHVFDHQNILPADVFEYGGVLRDRAIAALKSK